MFKHIDSFIPHSLRCIPPSVLTSSSTLRTHIRNMTRPNHTLRIASPYIPRFHPTNVLPRHTHENHSPQSRILLPTLPPTTTPTSFTHILRSLDTLHHILMCIHLFFTHLLMSSHRPMSIPHPSSTFSHHDTSTPTPTQLPPLRTNTPVLEHTRSDASEILTTTYVHFHSIHIADLPCFELHDPCFPAFPSFCTPRSTLTCHPSPFDTYAYLPSHIHISCKPKGIRGLHAQRAFHLKLCIHEFPITTKPCRCGSEPVC